jgi:hypothetical protein
MVYKRTHTTSPAPSTARDRQWVADKYREKHIISHSCDLMKGVKKLEMRSSLPFYTVTGE